MKLSTIFSAVQKETLKALWNETNYGHLGIQVVRYNRRHAKGPSTAQASDWQARWPDQHLSPHIRCQDLEMEGLLTTKLAHLTIGGVP